ncbi:MAG: glycoside hydrolase family 97 N-terminal domain-containing protein, partial [Parabacteroides sp.]|nr:glycoside hydrolase family 97 N-terminal domain-containing protein [Parabacteroides sp.]
MKKILTLWVVLCVAMVVYGQKSYQLSSPNGNIQLSVSIADKIYYDIAYDQENLLEKGTMQLQVGNQWLGENPKLSKSTVRSVDETMSPVMPFKFSKIRNHYNQLLLKFRGNYSVEFRAFDDGVAYR